MKKIISLLLLMLLTGAVPVLGARQGETMKPDNEKIKKAQRKFQILVTNEDKVKNIQMSNERLLQLQNESYDAAQRGLLGDLLWTGVTSAIKQKTVNASSNIVSLGLSYLTEIIKGNREKWYRAAKEQCHYSQVLSSESTINDFYALPSTKGAMDPENLRFEGFGCRNYMEVMDSSGEGVGIFYIFCKMRRDEEGLRHIVSHSKFQIEIDTLIFNPKYCNLPNDSTGSAESRFNFEKRDNLNLTLKIRLYSSWMNQATMIINDQKLGEFTIRAKIDKNKLNSEGAFIYDKNDPDFQRLVSVEGDCFIVPRSYTGTTDGSLFQPSWGTGQYRVEMEVSESCRIVDDYYQIREAGNGEAVAFADATPGKRKWDKAKWKTEWKAMNSRRKGDSFWSNAWQCVVQAYRGSGWIATLTDPVTTALYSYETVKLDDAFNALHKSWFEKEETSSTGNIYSSPVPENNLSQMSFSDGKASFPIGEAGEKKKK